MSSYRPVRGSGKDAVQANGAAGPGSAAGGPYSKVQHLPPPQRAASSNATLPPLGSVAAVPAPPPPQAEAVATLWVGSLLPSVTDDDLFEAFSPYGFVTDVNMMENQSPSGQLQAYVKFTFRAEAEEALSGSLNRQLLVKGKAVTCRWAQQDLVSLAQLKSAALNAVSASSTQGSSTTAAGGNFTAPKVWIGNLPMGTTEADLTAVFRAVGGELVDIIIHKKPSQYGQLSGFLRFKTQLETEMMLRAISSGAIQVKGATLKAGWAKGTSPP